MKKLVLAAASAAAAFAAPATAKVVSEREGAFVTRDVAVVKADLRTTWLKLISPGDWWDDAHTWSGDAANMSIVPQGGGCFCERIPAEDSKTSIGLDGSVQHMVVLNATPDLVLRMRGGLGPLQSEPVDGVLTIALSKTDKGTLIAFEYAVGGFMRFETPVIAKAVDGVMSQQLDHLAEGLGRVDMPEDKPDDEVEEKSDGAEAKDADGEKPVGEVPEAEDKSDRISVDEAFGDIE
ncbi:SRPBCC family protein [Parerythrobacter lacustris]|uniref:SRPBCC family protein n=1 Tax=Parerythrobacter lacustris TaxID=2969984 RepID=A0ABT1XPF9_9SPHN|nr:SRPBCC family protein [Parerythrobacter lacustris]MCR2833560.1 SRPBCC family protein [Parerythrobacter lacustris]